MRAGHAAAKVNLALAVTGRRTDGYHLIDSFVVFADYGDEVSVESAAEDRFTVTGEYAGQLTGSDTAKNLVLQARNALRTSLVARGIDAPPVALHLVKRLPVASGIGGGSADAAATLRILCRHWGHAPGPGELEAIAAPLGADVPMCLAQRPLRARGIGDEIAPVVKMPSFWMVLANAGVPVSTPAIFARLAKRENPPLVLPTSFNDASAIADWTRSARNDLLKPAIELAPDIDQCLAALRRPPTLAAGMSGSGATCFAIFANEADARETATTLRARHPSWFIAATRTLPSPPEFSPTPARMPGRSRI